jgi:hypothetical protein
MPVVILAFLLSGCNAGADKKQNDSLHTDTDSTTSSLLPHDSTDLVVKSIIAISANDFYKNQQPMPVAFRNVQIKYYIKPDHELLYILCGEFTVDDKRNKNEWIHFTTIKNIDYEQWIGPSGLTYCENSKEIAYSKTDLSVELLNKLNSLTKTKKQ